MSSTAIAQQCQSLSQRGMENTHNFLLSLVHIIINGEVTFPTEAVGLFQPILRVLPWTSSGRATNNIAVDAPREVRLASAIVSELLHEVEQQQFYVLATILINARRGNFPPDAVQQALMAYSWKTIPGPEATPSTEKTITPESNSISRRYPSIPQQGADTIHNFLLCLMRITVCGEAVLPPTALSMGSRLCKSLPWAVYTRAAYHLAVTASFQERITHSFANFLRTELRQQGCIELSELLAKIQIAAAYGEQSPTMDSLRLTLKAWPWQTIWDPDARIEPPSKPKQSTCERPVARVKHDFTDPYLPGVCARCGWTLQAIRAAQAAKVKDVCTSRPREQIIAVREKEIFQDMAFATSSPRQPMECATAPNFRSHMMGGPVYVGRRK